MIRRMRFFRNFVVENVRNGAIEADGKPARAKLKVNRSREARKRQTLRETLAGSPKTSDGGRDDSREARKRETGRERLAGSPRERNSENDARGKPAERFLNV